MGYGRVRRSSAGRHKKQSTIPRRSSKGICLCMKCPAAFCAARRRGGICWRARPSCCSSFGSKDDDFSYFDSEKLVIMELENRRKARLSDSSAAVTKSMENLYWMLSPDSGKLHIALPSKEVPLGVRERPNDDCSQGKDDEREAEAVNANYEDMWKVAQDEEFFSARSCFSQCSSERSSGGGDVVFLVADGVRGSGSNTRPELQSVLDELGRHCDGWPFGLRRKVAAAVLPPLPRSPSDSWTWCYQRGRGTVLYKLH